MHDTLSRVAFFVKPVRLGPSPSMFSMTLTARVSDLVDTLIVFRPHSVRCEA